MSEPETRREGFALTDMLVGLTVLGLSLALCLHAGAQALSASREAAALNATRRSLQWRMDSEWQAAKASGGHLSGKGWAVETGLLDAPSGWAVCRIAVTAEAPRGHRQAATHKFCRPPQ